MKNIKIILTDEQIKSIAEDLEIGMKVYVHLETNEIKTVVDVDELYGDSEEWEEDLNEIEKNYDKYCHFEKMDTRESFKLMQDFVGTVEDDNLRGKLGASLGYPKPFRNFKRIIDNENYYRQQWFQFKAERYIEFVKEQVEMHNRRISL